MALRKSLMLSLSKHARRFSHSPRAASNAAPYPSRVMKSISRRLTSGAFS
jgi:hypothetical protein